MIVPKYIIDQDIVNKEIEELENILNEQRQLKKTLLLYLEKISEGIYNTANPQDTNQIHSFLDEVQKCFDSLKENISNISDLKKYLEEITTTNGYDGLNFEEYNNKYNKITNKINDDNNKYYSFMESLFDFITVTFPEVIIDNKINQNNNSNLQYSVESIENNNNIIDKDNSNANIENNIVDNTSINEISDVVIVENSNTTPEEVSISFEEPQEVSIENNTFNLTNNEEVTIPETNNQVEESNSVLESPNTVESNENTDDSDIDEVLFISYKDEYAILPHSTEDIEKLFSNSPEKYSSLQDIIEKEYTISLKSYKLNSSSVYDECYNLAKKEDYSSLKAIKFASSIKKIPNVNPLAIRACKNIENVENYLKCLEANKMDEFKLFKIIEEK